MMDIEWLKLENRNLRAELEMDKFERKSFGETIVRQYEQIERLEAKVEELKAEKQVLLEAVKAAYRKHHMGDDYIGWDGLSDILFAVLCNILGDKGFQDWKAALNEE
jgi:hypothetical protein